MRMLKNEANGVSRPASRRPRGWRGATMAALCMAAFMGPSSAAVAQSSTSFSVFDVPLGATATEVEAMALQRGFAGPSPVGRCIEARICSRQITIENLPDTEFTTAMWGSQDFPGRTEAFTFAFAAPPNAHTVWAAGSDQNFGDRMRPSADAPLVNDVVAELTRRFGPPSRTFALGGAEVSANRPVGEFWWVWDSAGRPIRWTQLVYDTCYRAMHQAEVLPGNSALADRNPAATDHRPFQLAQRGGCAKVVHARFSYTRGLVYSLSVRINDFQAGNDAFAHTLRLVRDGVTQSNERRSQRNPPRF